MAERDGGNRGSEAWRLRKVAHHAERRGREILVHARARRLMQGPSRAARLRSQTVAVARSAARLGLTAALMPFVAWRMWRRRSASRA